MANAVQGILAVTGSTMHDHNKSPRLIRWYDFQFVASGVWMSHCAIRTAS
jgi:hypothetical protein